MNRRQQKKSDTSQNRHVLKLIDHIAEYDGTIIVCGASAERRRLYRYFQYGMTGEERRCVIHMLIPYYYGCIGTVVAKFNDRMFYATVKRILSSKLR